MGWVRQTKKPCSHPTRPVLPKYYGNEHMVGDVWECDNEDCKQRFEVTTTILTDGPQWDHYKVTGLTWQEKVTHHFGVGGIYYPPGVR